MRKLLGSQKLESTYSSSEATATNSSSSSELETTTVSGLIGFLRWLRLDIIKVGWRENQKSKNCEDQTRKVSWLYTFFFFFFFQPILDATCTQNGKMKGNIRWILKSPGQACHKLKGTGSNLKHQKIIRTTVINLILYFPGADRTKIKSKSIKPIVGCFIIVQHWTHSLRQDRALNIIRNSLQLEKR